MEAHTPVKIVTYKDGAIENIWLNRDLAERFSIEEIHELPDDHPDILAKVVADRAAREADAADRKTLRDQILGATEAQWLALTETQRQKIILKALKYMARNL
jgi:hypothetical protein